MSDRIAIFDRGRIQQLGTGEDLYERPISVFVADFVGESNMLRGRLERRRRRDAGCTAATWRWRVDPTVRRCAGSARRGTGRARRAARAPAGRGRRRAARRRERRRGGRDGGPVPRPDPQDRAGPARRRRGRRARAGRRGRRLATGRPGAARMVGRTRPSSCPIPPSARRLPEPRRTRTRRLIPMTRPRPGLPPDAALRPRGLAREPAVHRTLDVRAAAAACRTWPTSTSRSSACPSTRASRIASAVGSGPTPCGRRRVMLRPYNTEPRREPVRGALVRRLRGRRDRARLHRAQLRAASSEAVAPIVEAGVVPLLIGGDHACTLPHLRATRSRGPVAVIDFDSHTDAWDSYFGEKYNHGTWMRRAIEEGLVDVAHSIEVGLRGSIYAAERLDGAPDGARPRVPHDRGGVRARARRRRSPDPRARRRSAGVPELRHRRRGSGPRSGHRHPRGGRPVGPGHARDRSRLTGHRFRRVRRRRGHPGLRSRPARPRRSPRTWRTRCSSLVALRRSDPR